jgi:hypothetical protein
MAAQASRAQRLAAADDVIDNSGTLAELQPRSNACTPPTSARRRDARPTNDRARRRGGKEGLCYHRRDSKRRDTGGSVR